MKKKQFALLLSLTALMACNMGENKANDDSIKKADSANEQLHDPSTGSAPQVIDEASTDFVVRAANSSMTDLEMSRIAQQHATMQQVKDFAQSLERDHQILTEEIRSLAGSKNITLPATVSTDAQKDIDKLKDKVDKNYDKSFVKMIVDRHKESIRLYEKATKEAGDGEIKTFANNSLVKLRMHLDSAQALEKRYW